MFKDTLHGQMEINRVSRHLIETLEKIRKWPTYPDFDSETAMSESQTAEIFTESFKIVASKYAEKYNPEQISYVYSSNSLEYTYGKLFNERTQ